MTDQLTREQAIAFDQSGAWKSMTERQIAEFQIDQELLCVPIDVFTNAVSVALGRPVYTHELATEELRQELMGERPTPTFEEILNRLPAHLRDGVVVCVSGAERETP